MLSEAHPTRRRILQAIDGALYSAALLAAYAVRSSVQIEGVPELESLGKYLWLVPPVWILGPMILSSESWYAGGRRWTRASAALRVLRSSAFLILGLILLLFLCRVQFARSVIILTGALGGLLVYIRHEVTEWTGARLERRRTLWLGEPDDIRALQAGLGAQERERLESVAELRPADLAPEEFTRLLHDHSVNVVVLSLPGSDRDVLERTLAACEREGVEVLIRPGLRCGSPYRMSAEVIAGEPVLHQRAQSADPAHLLAKQVFDYCGAFLLLVVLSPVLALTALAVRIFSGGPILFRQERAGLNGRPFRMLKFRTMTVGAEERQPELASTNEMKGPVFKVKRDPRVTAIGRILRRHGLDELPQLVNVLRGEMSLVGPRPLPVGEVARFSDPAHRRRLSVKPGLTCLWQINGRNEIADFGDWVQLDLAYIDQWSLWLDLKILAATVPVVLFGRGGR